MLPRQLVASLFALALAWASACVTERTDEPANLGSAVPLNLARDRVWRVVDGNELVGIVVRFADPARSDTAAGHLYSVRNALEQELGTIDGLGRAWRFEPHSREPRWVATGTLIEGARAILDANVSAHLVALDGPENSTDKATR